jgi:hypothetical protein
MSMTEDRNLADPPAYPASGDDTGAESDPEATTGTPRWVKVFGVIALVLVVLVVLMLVVGGGNHGPGRHTGGSQIARSGDIEAGGAGVHTSPARGRTAR